MTRRLKTIMAAFLGTFLLTSVACENKDTEAALKTCKSDLSNEQKKVTDEQTTITSLKAQLASVQAKVDEMTKTAQAAKPDEKSKAGDAKKDEPAKTAKNDNKKAKKK